MATTFWCVFESEGQGVYPAAQSGHFHLNRGPWVPSGVTLATVKTIVAAVSVCVRERKKERLLCALHDPKTYKIFKLITGCPKQQTCQASLGKIKFNEPDIYLATADTAAKCQSILMANLG